MYFLVLYFYINKILLIIFISNRVGLNKVKMNKKYNISYLLIVLSKYTGNL